jgi:L-alanine-DL-glutamate epimerase-like enolase superfamily enzyme
MKIDRVEVRVVAPQVKRYTWSHDLPQQYMTNTIIRIYTDDGVEGFAGVSNYTSHDFDRYTAETLRHVIPDLIGLDPLRREDVAHRLRPRVFPLSPGAMALIDIALWDLLGRVSGLPIWRLLGGARDRILSYGSTPLLADIPAYLQFVDDLIEQGFRAIKFHSWCDPERDLELVRAVRRNHPGNEIAFMLDVENNYDRNSALRVARELEDLDFTWFEAPLPDQDIEGYCQLTRQVRIPILPSGNWIQDLPSFASGLQKHAWSAARTDATVCGGITAAQKAMSLAQAAGMQCEIMCWGFTLISTANLHLMLGCPNATYYEQPVPYDSYEYGMIDAIRTNQDGHVMAPTGPGLGVEVDWKAMSAATIHTICAGRSGPN